LSDQTLPVPEAIQPALLITLADSASTPRELIGVPTAIDDAVNLGPARLPNSVQQALAAAAAAAGTGAPSTGSAAATVPGDATVHTSQPPRVAARGSGKGRSMGRRGVEGSFDERGLPLPEYPSESRRLNEEGVVKLDVEVLTDGSVGAVTMVEDSGYARLNEAAVAAIKQRGAFEPGTIDGVPAVLHLVVPYSFELHRSSSRGAGR
jgi:protein TonB